MIMSTKTVISGQTSNLCAIYPIIFFVFSVTKPVTGIKNALCRSRGHFVLLPSDRVAGVGDGIFEGRCVGVAPDCDPVFI